MAYLVRKGYHIFQLISHLDFDDLVKRMLKKRRKGKGMKKQKKNKKKQNKSKAKRKRKEKFKRMGNVSKINEKPNEK